MSKIGFSWRYLAFLASWRLWKGFSLFAFFFTLSLMEDARFRPLVKSIASELHQCLVPDRNADELFRWGLDGLSDGLQQYRPRQGLTQRMYLIYRIRSAIYSGLATQDWRSDDARLHYLFLKKANELLLNFHLSAEATIKRSIRAEAEEIFQLLNILTIVAFLSQPGLYHVDLGNSLRTLEEKEQDLIRYHYEQDLDLKEVSKKIGLSEPSAYRLHLQALEKIARGLAGKVA